MSFVKFATPMRITALLGAAALGLSVWHSPLFGAEAPVIIAPPAVDNPKTAGPAQTSGACGRLLLGRARRVRTCPRCKESLGGIRRR